MASTQAPPEPLELVGKHLDVDDPDFPVIGPDLWQYEGTDGALDEHWETVKDRQERRERYKKAMLAHRASRNNTFKKNCKHMIKDTMYKEVDGNFYIPPVDQVPRDNFVHKARITMHDKSGKPTSQCVANAPKGDPPLSVSA